MCDESVSDSAKVELLRKSANYQHGQTRLASVGKGCDRHLFGLYLIAKVKLSSIQVSKIQLFQD